VTAGKVPDGMSNTMIVGEQSGLPSGTETRKGYQGGFGGSPFNASGFGSNVVAKWPCWPGGSTAGGSFDIWTQAVTSVRHPINAKGSLPGNGGAYDPNSLISSMHPGSANILLGDGSSRNISESIDLSILMRLSSRNDGQALPADY
jgi:prepilin-type processing-associated H-X9-DG protein